MNEMSDIILGSLIGAISALIGALIGSVIAPRLNHMYSLEKLEKEHEKKIDYMKEEFKFNQKIKGYQNILNMLEEDRKVLDQLYKNLNMRKKAQKKLDDNFKKNGLKLSSLKIFIPSKIYKEFNRYIASWNRNTHESFLQDHQQILCKRNSIIEFQDNLEEMIHKDL